MKKLYLLVFTLLSLPVVTMQAQVVDENETHDDETEITVTNAKGKKEVIDLPEAMTMQLDSLMHLYNTKTYLRPDTTCNLPDINPVYDASVYKLRLSKLPTIIEMPYNDVVQKFIDLYSGQLRRSVSYMLGAQNRVSLESTSCLTCGRNRIMAVHAQHRKALRSDRKFFGG